MGTSNAQINPDHINEDSYVNGSSIEAFFAESVILLTGATGFLGKALLEKLLRSCPRLATIFILIRPKQGQTIEKRYKSLIQNSVFDRIRADRPEAFNKIHPIKGDVTMADLGLSPGDKNLLLQKVTVVFHSAATVKFNEPLKVAVNLNTKGTDRVIDLCKHMKNLISIIHVSTAYSNANRQEVKESIYTTKVKPSTVIDMCESLDDDTLNILEKKILEKHPNTYTFTKNLAEQLVLSKATELPIAIVRPSIVCAAQEEPFPGWVDNLCGLTGIMMEIGKGTIRSIVCNQNMKVDLVPIDYVVDTIICASWHSAMQQDDTIRVYNCTNCVSPIRWGNVRDLISKHAIESPSKHVMWYPGVTFTTNKFLHNFIAATLHFFPAFLVDFFLRLLGNKPTMFKHAQRLDRAVNTGSFFVTHEWNFQRSNMVELTKQVRSLKDSEHFNTDMHSFEWDTYMRRYTLGIRKFILRDNLESMNIARSRLLILYWIHRLTQISSIIILFAMIRRIGH